MPLDTNNLKQRMLMMLQPAVLSTRMSISPIWCEGLPEHQAFSVLTPEQVKHAEDAGASGAIVYDDVYEALIIMSKPRDHAEPGIPSVFVAQKTGIVMRKLMTPGATIVRITPVRPQLMLELTYIDHTFSWQLMSTLSLCEAVMFVYTWPMIVTGADRQLLLLPCVLVRWMRSSHTARLDIY